MCRTFLPFTDMIPDRMHSCETHKSQAQQIYIHNCLYTDKTACSVNACLLYSKQVRTEKLENITMTLHYVRATIYKCIMCKNGVLHGVLRLLSCATLWLVINQASQMASNLLHWQSSTHTFHHRACTMHPKTNLRVSNFSWAKESKRYNSSEMTS